MSGSSKIKAITFDFWDTIAIDESDEIERSKLGLAPKSQERIKRIFQVCQEIRPGTTTDAVERTWSDTTDWFNDQWLNQRNTPTVKARLEKFSEIFFGTPSIRDTERLCTLASGFESMEVEHPPSPAANIVEALKDLSRSYKLGIISDTIFTPGTGLKLILAKFGVVQLFDSFVFSDETGFCKPDRRVFEISAKNFGLKPEELVHVGDREANDVVGPLEAGLKAILYTGIKDRGASQTRATAVCRDHSELQDLVKNC